MAKRFLSLDEIVAEAMTIVPGASSEDFLLAKQWAYTALREIGPSSDYINVATLYPDNLSLAKPDDYYKAIDLALYSGIPDSGTEIPYSFRSGKHRIHQYGPNVRNIVEVSESSDFFHLSSNADHVTYAVLRYFTLPVDHNGQPMFPEHCRLAVMLFIRYMWAVRHGERDWPLHKQAWDEARNAARSRSKLPNGMQYRQFAREWITMIPNTKLTRY